MPGSSAAAQGAAPAGPESGLPLSDSLLACADGDCCDDVLLEFIREELEPPLPPAVPEPRHAPSPGAGGSAGGGLSRQGSSSSLLARLARLRGGPPEAPALSGLRSDSDAGLAARLERLRNGWAPPAAGSERGAGSEFGEGLGAGSDGEPDGGLLAELQALEAQLAGARVEVEEDSLPRRPERHPELGPVAEPWEHDEGDIQVLVATGAMPPTAADDDGRTALHACAERGNVPGIRALLKAGAVLDAADHAGCTPLMAAAAAGQLRAVRLLLAAGADARLEGAGGETALSMACQRDRDGGLGIVDALLQAGAAPDHWCTQAGATPLLRAAARGSVGVVRALLAAGADPAKQDAQYGMTALGWAAEKGWPGVALALLRAGAPWDARDRDGDSPLSSAARNGHLGVARMLLAAGADPNTRHGEQQWTALHDAALHGHLDVALELLAAGADADAALVTSGCTPLWLAAKHGHLAVVLGLLRAGASLDDVNPANGHTLLHKVAEAGHADVAAALLSHGGLRLLGARDHSGRTALDVAAPEAKTALEAAAQQLRGCVERGLGEEGETAQEGRAERRLGGRALYCQGLAEDVDRAAGGNVRGGYTLTVLLLQDADILTHEELTECLLVAASEGDSEAAEALLQEGAALDASTHPGLHAFYRGKSALFMAAEQGHAEMVRRLLAEGADLAAPAASGDTPLHAALRGGHAAVAAALLQAGASLGVKGADGRTAHELAPPGALEVAEAEQAHEVAVAPALRLSEAERLLEDGRPGEAADAYLGAASLCAGQGQAKLQLHCLLRAAECSLHLGDASKCADACTALLLGGLVPPAASWRVLLLRSRAHQAQGSPHAAAVDVLRAEEQAPAEELRAALAEAAHRSVEATARSLGRTASCGRRHCIKCLDRAPRIALVPCGHAVLCQGCSSSLELLHGRCPECRQAFFSSLRVHI